MEVYFDNSATTRPYEEVVKEVSDTMLNIYGNPSAVHTLGLKAEEKLSDCRKIFADALGCGEDEIFFTSCATESNNFLLKGSLKPGNHIITTKIEHASILNTCKELEQSGVKVTYLDVDKEGRIDIESLKKSIDKDTRVVSIMLVNNEVGTIQDIETIGKEIKKISPWVKFHVDAVQGFCKIPINVRKMNIDMLSTSAHKIHGPRGVGFAYIRKGLVPRPLVLGGGQEKGFRSGTENLPGIAGYAKACEIMSSHIKENYDRVLEVKKYFINRLSEVENIKINGSASEEYLPYILNVSFLGVKGEVFLHYLEGFGIYVSTGSACSYNSNEKSGSHVLNAMGLSKEEIRGAIRFSFSEMNTKDEVDYVIPKIKSGLEFLRRVKK